VEPDAPPEHPSPAVGGDPSGASPPPAERVPPRVGRGGLRALRAAVEGVLPAERFADQRNILGNTGQNVVGLGIGALATFAAQVLMTNALGPERFGVVTVATQFAFIAAAATRFGMDVANVRLVAILVGKGEAGRARGLVARAGAIAGAVSAAFAVLAFLGSGALAERFTALPREAAPAFRAAALAVPLAALAFTYMGATRGLKIMRYTLYAQWTAQPLGWIVLALAGWPIARTAGVTTLAYAASWALALGVAWWGWEREARGLVGRREGAGIPEERTAALLRFGALRAPATLFSQLIFWADFYVLSRLSSGRGLAGAADVGVYGAALRAAQSLFLFLTSVSLTFSPFVADLHHRGERERLDALYKAVTRWTLAATIPVLLVLAVLPGPVLRIFGGEFARGEAALRILIVGAIVPVCVGTVGFILIMAGRTGWDLLVYLGGLAIDVGIALALARPERLGIAGAALAQACTLSASAVARLLLVRRFLGIWPFDRHFLRLAAPAAAGAAAMLALDALVPDARWALDLLVAGGLGAVAYLGALVAVGLKPGERRAALALARGVLRLGAGT